MPTKPLAKEKHDVAWHREKSRYDAMNDIFDDLPDGAYFAAMEESGFDVDDHIEYGNSK